jgi:hypothetical protein
MDKIRIKNRLIILEIELADRRKLVKELMQEIEKREQEQAALVELEDEINRKEWKFNAGK